VNRWALAVRVLYRCHGLALGAGLRKNFSECRMGRQSEQPYKLTRETNTTSPLKEKVAENDVEKRAALVGKLRTTDARVKRETRNLARTDRADHDGLRLA
jgi:hypothetical protein